MISYHPPFLLRTQTALLYLVVWIHHVKTRLVIGCTVIRQCTEAGQFTKSSSHESKYDWSNAVSTATVVNPNPISGVRMNFLHSRRNVEILGAKAEVLWSTKEFKGIKLTGLTVIEQRRCKGQGPECQDATANNSKEPQRTAKNCTCSCGKNGGCCQVGWRSEVHALALQRSGSSGSEQTETSTEGVLKFMNLWIGY